MSIPPAATDPGADAQLLDLTSASLASAVGTRAWRARMGLETLKRHGRLASRRARADGPAAPAGLSPHADVAQQDVRGQRGRGGLVHERAWA